VARRCAEDLAQKLHFIDASEVEGWSVVRTTHAYPVYDLQYSSNLKVINEWLAGMTGLHIVGRGGTFRYNNADHSVEMGLLLGRKLLGHEVDHLQVNTEQEYQEEIRSTDLKRDQYKVKPESVSSRSVH
jgi:hypothetical protein